MGPGKTVFHDNPDVPEPVMGDCCSRARSLDLPTALVGEATGDAMLAAASSDTLLLGARPSRPVAHRSTVMCLRADRMTNSANDLTVIIGLLLHSAVTEAYLDNLLVQQRSISPSLHFCLDVYRCSAEVCV